MNKNKIEQIRTTSTFNSFKPQTEGQSIAKKTLEEIVGDITAGDNDFAGDTNPFENGGIIVLSGTPGVGKTHLIESFINELKIAAPHAAQKTFLLRDDLTLTGISGIGDYTFDRKIIIILDDVFSNKQSVANLHPATDLKVLMDLISYLYEERALCIMTTNFPFINEIIPAIAKADNIGRITSRCKEMLGARGTECDLSGPDYRQVLAQEAATGNKTFAGRLLKRSVTEPDKLKRQSGELSDGRC